MIADNDRGATSAASTFAPCKRSKPVSLPVEGRLSEANVAKTGTLTFAPGETTKTITIEVKGDSKKEADETFYLDLFGLSSNAMFTKNRGVGTILNDD